MKENKKVGTTYCRNCNVTIQKGGMPDLDLIEKHQCQQKILFKHAGELDKPIQDIIINILAKEGATDIDIDFIKSE